MHYFLTFIILYGIWLIFSGLFDAFHMTLGVISSLIITLTSTKLLFKNHTRTFAHRMGEVFRGIHYSTWLLWQIFLANLQVFVLALSPRMMEEIEPQVICVKTKLKSDFAKYVLANSITLTPGTVTVKVDGDMMYIHAISDKVAIEVPGEMENRIAALFGEDIS